MIEYNSDISTIIMDTPVRKVESFESGGISYIRTAIKPLEILGISIDAFARRQCAKEIEALKYLRGIEGVPYIHRIESPTSYFSECPECKPVTHTKVDAKYFKKALRILREMHHRGVLPLEFGAPKLYADKNGNPIIIVGTTYVNRKRIPNKGTLTLRDRLFNKLYDWNKAAILDAKHKLIPGSRTREEIRTIKETNPGRLKSAYVALMMFMQGYRPT